MFKTAFIHVCGAVIALTQLPATLSAIPPSPHVIEERQPDGTVIKVRLRGSATLNWYEDLHGFAVVRIPKRYVYALRNAQGLLTPTPLLVGEVDPATAGLRKGIEPTLEALKAWRTKPGKAKQLAEKGQFTQPGGREVKLHVRESHGYHWFEDLQGYSAVEVPARFEYALVNAEGALIPTGALVGKVDPEFIGLRSGARPTSP